MLAAISLYCAYLLLYGVPYTVYMPKISGDIIFIFSQHQQTSFFPYTVRIAPSGSASAAAFMRLQATNTRVISNMALLLTFVVLSGNCLASCYCSTSSPLSPLNMPRASTANNQYPATHTFSPKQNPRAASMLAVTPFVSNIKAETPSVAALATSTSLRAGAATSSDSSNKSGKCPFTTTVGLLSSLWGSVGVVYILVKAIKRVLPIALEPFAKGGVQVPLTNFQLV